MVEYIAGATTVAGTMYIASLVGIDVFVTGGIGGVHRGAEISIQFLFKMLIPWLYLRLNAELNHKPH